MKGSKLSRPLYAAAAIAILSAGPLQSGNIVPPEPPFVAPPTGGLVDPVFVPTSPVATAVSGGVSDAETRLIVTELNAAQDFCRQMPSEEYTIDCLGDTLKSVADSLPSSGDYADAKRVLADTSERLRSLAQANASRTLPTGRIGNSSRQSATPLTPVARDRLASATAQAIEIINEAETVLLRSAANSAARKVHYQRIASAVGSNKVLLRST